MMADTQPIKDYIAALDAHRAGRIREACQSLAEAMGAEKPTAVIESSINQLLTPNTIANEAALKLVATKTARRK